MCQDYLLYYSDNLPIELSEIGQWWGTDPKKKKQIQIDIVGTPNWCGRTRFDSGLRIGIWKRKQLSLLYLLERRIDGWTSSSTGAW